MASAAVGKGGVGGLGVDVSKAGFVTAGAEFVGGEGVEGGVGVYLGECLHVRIVVAVSAVG